MSNEEIIAEDLKEKIQIVVFSGEKYDENMILDESESLAIALEDVKVLLQQARAEGRNEIINKEIEAIHNTYNKALKCECWFDDKRCTKDSEIHLCIEHFELVEKEGRQSAQKEIDDLNILILNERAEKQEQVRKLMKKIETECSGGKNR